jgi:hypothetical protein
LKQSTVGIKFIKKSLTQTIELFVDSKKSEKAENKRKEKMARKDSGASSIDSYEFSQKSLIIDFSMFFYVFDKIVEKYMKIKKNTQEAQKTLKTLEDSSESPEDSDPWELEQPVEIIGREEMLK